MKKILLLIILAMASTSSFARMSFICSSYTMIDQIPLVKLTDITLPYTIGVRYDRCIDVHDETPVEPFTVVIATCSTDWGNGGSIPCAAIKDKKQYDHYYAANGNAYIGEYYDRGMVINDPQENYGAAISDIVTVIPHDGNYNLFGHLKK